MVVHKGAGPATKNLLTTLLAAGVKKVISGRARDRWDTYS